MACVTFGTHCEEAEFSVMAEKRKALLERETAIKVGVQKIGKNSNINAVQNDDKFTQYADEFHGLEKLKDFKLEIHVPIL